MSNDGTVTALINADACTDISGNPNTASINTDNSVLYKTTKPGVTITRAANQLDPCNTSPINFTATFTEIVTGFDASDIILGGTAGATNVLITGSGPAYNIAITGMIDDGTVSISIDADACTDIAGNFNTASSNTDNLVLYETTKPGVTITQAAEQLDPCNYSPINFSVIFTEDVYDFNAADIKLGGTAHATNVMVTGSGHEYNLAISGMTNDGTVTMAIGAGACKDIAGNSNIASINTDNSVLYEITRPGVTISLAEGQLDPTNLSPINFTATFIEAVTGFESSDIALSGTSGATEVLITGSGTVYNLAISGMTADGTVSVSISENVCTDFAGNWNTASVNVDNSVIFQKSDLIVNINQDLNQADPTNQLPIVYRVEFNRSVSDFEYSDISWSGTATGIEGNIQGSGAIYNLNITNISSVGTLIASIPVNLVHDALKVGNQASISTDNTVLFDNVKPDVVIDASVTNPTSQTEMPIRFVFSKSVTGFEIENIKITNGTIVSLAETETGIRWEGILKPVSPGQVNVQVPSEATFDAAGNYNNESNLIQFEYIPEEIMNFEANNVFTPNSSFNRYWKIRNVQYFKNYELVIRNSSGQIVFQTTNYENDWNGTYKNKPLPTGTYYYFLSNSSKNIVHKGFVNIIYE